MTWRGDMCETARPARSGAPPIDASRCGLLRHGADIARKSGGDFAEAAMKKAIVLSLVGAMLCACTSIESTLISENPDGEIVTQRVAGVPIIVTVPRKTGFLVTEDVHFSSTGKVTEVTLDKTPIPLGESQLVTLDVKRPFYGSLKGRIVLDAQRQYPTSVSSTVDDKTLGEIVQGLTGAPQDAASPIRPPSNLRGTTRCYGGGRPSVAWWQTLPAGI